LSPARGVTIIQVMTADPLHIDTIPLHAWLIEAGLAGAPVEELFDGLCQRLVAAGVPIARGFLSIAGLHPQRRASSLTWREGTITDVNDFPHETMATPLWRDSPFRHMVETRTRRLHRRLTGDDVILDYPVFREFRDLGLTEWLALLHGFGSATAASQPGQLGLILSWATASAGGWNAAQLAAIEELSGTLALATKGSALPGVMHDLLAAYVGGDAADRVIAGQVQRGSVNRVAAAILYADLRGFTDFAEATAPEEVTRRLNGVFDCLGEPVRAAGGEILKFLGDGVLVVFLPKKGAGLGTVAAAALAATREILVRMAALNATESAAGRPTLVLDLALHAGDVTYGNIGTADRVDFTVIGPAVNEATRLESLCKELGEPVLISESFVRAAPGLEAQLCSVGRHRLRGVREEKEVFALADGKPRVN
jgi:adenylate cyclase